MIDASPGADENRVNLFLGPTIFRSCFTVTAVNDDIPEEPNKDVDLEIEISSNSYQISNTASNKTVTILDDDCECKND